MICVSKEYEIKTKMAQEQSGQVCLFIYLIVHSMKDNPEVYKIFSEGT